jgi:hypothetical protein
MTNLTRLPIWNVGKLGGINLVKLIHLCACASDVVVVVVVVVVQQKAGTWYVWFDWLV